MAPEVMGGQWYCPFAADAWSLGICILALLAPRDVDEYEFNRTPFYPFLVADADVDPEYAAYLVSQTNAPALPPVAIGISVGAGAAPTAPLPPGLSSKMPMRIVRPPGLSWLPAAASTRHKTDGASRSPTAQLIERRAVEDGHAMPCPPLAPEVLNLMDGLLAPAAHSRLSVADAARRLRYDLCIPPA